VFSKLARAIMAAARSGGGDPNSNIRLKAVLDDARAVRMPKENIERAIKKGTGELEGEQIEEAVYEAYGPGGVAMLIEILTDNRNRTASVLRKLLDTHGGSLAGSGATAWLFSKKGLVCVAKRNATEERLFETTVEAGADEIEEVGDSFHITCEPASLEKIKRALDGKSIPIESAQVTMLPSSSVPLDVETGQKILRLMDALDDEDDVANVHANFDLPAEILACHK
jgi:YebC/PmpR family DNA-binding regulatory protein